MLPRSGSPSPQGSSVEGASYGRQGLHSRLANTTTRRAYTGSLAWRFLIRSLEPDCWHPSAGHGQLARSSPRIRVDLHCTVGDLSLQLRPRGTSPRQIMQRLCRADDPAALTALSKCVASFSATLWVATMGHCITACLHVILSGPSTRYTQYNDRGERPLIAISRQHTLR